MSLAIRGEHAGNYFVVLCQSCGGETKNDYLGWDPAMPRFRARCEPCGTETTVKLTGVCWAGLPEHPSSN